MSLLNITGKGGSPLTRLVDQLSLAIREGGTEFASSRYTDQVCSLESLNDADLASLNSAAQGISETISAAFESIAETGQSLGFEALSPTQKEAGPMVALAAGNPMAYATAAMTKRAGATDGVSLIGFESAGVAGRLDYREEHASMEAFDEKKLAEMMPYSIAFNVQASRQDEFSESFYPTTIVSPDMGGIDIAVDRTTVFNAIHHPTSGKAHDWKQRNLVEAVSDASILADESIALIPFVQENGENEAMFLDDAVVAPTYRRVGNVDIKTKPLKVGKQINLLGISQHPQLLGAGIIDHTDAIDSRIFLDKLYLRTSDTGSVLRFNVSRLPRNAFNKSVEGADREMQLNFRSEALVLNADTMAVDGSEPTVLQPVRDSNYTVRLAIKVNGDAHVEFGTVQIDPSAVQVTEITDEDCNQVSLTAGGGKAIVDALADMKIVGFELNASRTNSNRRTRGLLLNNNREVERFAIPLGAPISAPSPIGSDRDTRALDSLIAAARIRNSNNAVTTLLNYADTLRAFVQNRRLGHGVPAIEGVGRHVVVPFYEEMDLNLKDVINSIKSKDRAEDISSVLVNAIRDVAYRMYRDSAYQAGVDASSVGGKKVSLLVGTDSVIQRHLMVTGDRRTFGTTFEDAKIVTTLDSRMDNKIVLTFTREGTDGTPDPLSFGTHAWIPELASSIMVSRDGATYQEAMVQPRSRHINNLPIMAVINVEGLEDVLTTKVAVSTESVDDGASEPEPEPTP